MPCFCPQERQDKTVSTLVDAGCSRSVGIVPSVWGESVQKVPCMDRSCRQLFGACVWHSDFCAMGLQFADGAHLHELLASRSNTDPQFTSLSTCA